MFIWVMRWAVPLVGYAAKQRQFWFVECVDKTKGRTRGH